MSTGFKKRELKGELKEIYDFLEIKHWKEFLFVFFNQICFI